MKLPYFVTTSLGLGVPVVEQPLHSYCCLAVGSFQIVCSCTGLICKMNGYLCRNKVLLTGGL